MGIVSTHTAPLDATHVDFGSSKPDLISRIGAFMLRTFSPTTVQPSATTHTLLTPNKFKVPQAQPWNGNRPAGHRITPLAPFDMQWRSKETPEERLAAGNRLYQSIHKTIFSENGAARVNQNKDVSAVVTSIRKKYGTARLVIGGQRAPDRVDPKSNAFIWDPYYNVGLQRAQPEDFSINIDLTANPDLWGDAAEAQTMDRLDNDSFDNILIEHVPIQAISQHGNNSAEDIAFAHHYLQAGIAQGSPYSSVVKEATTYSCSRAGLNTWQHLARVLTPGGQLVAHCLGHHLIDRNTVADIIQATQKYGLLIHQVTLSKSTISPAFSATKVTVDGDLNTATVTVSRDGLFGTSKRTATGTWHWQNHLPLPHFDKLLAITHTGARQHDVFDTLTLYATKY